MWDLDHKEGWVPKNWCFWALVLDKTFESLDSKEIKPVNPKGNQPWIFIGRADAENKAPVVCPPDTNSQLIRKDPDAGKDWGQEEKRATEDEMVRWHHQFNGHEFEQTLGDSKGQGSLACCSPWGRKRTWLSDWTTTKWVRKPNCKEVQWSVQNHPINRKKSETYNQVSYLWVKIKHFSMKDRSFMIWPGSFSVFPKLQPGLLFSRASFCLLHLLFPCLKCPFCLHQVSVFPSFFQDSSHVSYLYPSPRVERFSYITQNLEHKSYHMVWT